MPEGRLAHLPVERQLNRLSMRQIVRSDGGGSRGTICAPMCPEVVNNLQEVVGYPRRVSQEKLSWLTGARRDG
jgi:hypothetical protein